MQKIFPFPALANFLVSIIAFFVIIIYGSSILMPIAISIMLALAIHPLVEYLGKKQFRKKPLFSKSGAILCAIFIVVLFLAAAITLAGSQITRLAADMPNLTQKFNTLLLNLQDMVEQYFGIAPEEQFQLVRNGLNQFFSASPFCLSTVLSETNSVIFSAIISGEFVFMNAGISIPVLCLNSSSVIFT
ncbi:MAG TPA: AI-2E family transporter, partial [Chitinophagales bacterium]|nr:AI-2E family transporter [Chitinophagales bacterium]